MKPTVGRIVHYVSYGTPGGEYGKECRAAVVTAVNDGDSLVVSLCVLNPTGQFFDQNVVFDEGAEKAGFDDCDQKSYHGNPFRFCGCGWMEAAYVGGTWHWPEREESPA